MAVKYLYLDDDPEDQVGQIARRLSVEGKLEVTYQSVSFFKHQIEQLLAPDCEFDGLLLDLRLDQKPREDGQKVEYTATTLAQFLRTKVYDDEVRIKDFPIVLCSQQSKIGMYEADLSSHDLFDYKFPKEAVEVRAEEIISKMVALVEGYRTIASAQGNWSKILAYDTTQLDARIFSRFTTNNTTLATHEYARHLVKGLLTTTNELIKERIVAARLGMTTTAADWPQLRDDVFGAARYQGAFGESWERWWQPEVNRIFESLCGAPIASLDAVERVAALTQYTKLTGLVAATPIELNHSPWYWTICEAYQTPLDPSEGFRLAGAEPAVWQEYDYISLKALLEQLHTTELQRQLHPDEVLRFEAIRENYA